ncbi:MAG: phenylalanine--tRNA ligase subunit beta [Candidatus Moraniibacteriota bacterium]
MKFSYNWLKELSETTKTPEEIKDLLTLHSFEVEGIEYSGAGLEKVVIGEVLKVEKHPDADKLNVAEVNIGKEKLQIVCGAPNLKVGQRVPVALVGAILPGDFEIKKTKIRGLESCGMICAEDELGLGSEHAGIMVLSEDAPIGGSLVDFFDLKDCILEIDVLPNRAHDALSYEGMAREIALLEGRHILDEKILLNQEFEIKDELSIKIETDKCPRYIGIKIEDVKIGESPEWIKQRLRASGLKPINNIVDITNYVMLQTGQPLHAFDGQKVSAISVRMAEKGEKIKILNGEEINLRQTDIVITDQKEPIALAGVMGGLQSGVSDQTRTIILESANFDAVNIRKTKSTHHIESDAAYRYERDIDVNFTERAACKALKMITELTGGKPVSAQDVYPQKREAWEIVLLEQKVNDLLGLKVPEKEFEKILKNLGIDFVKKDNEYRCLIPTRRLDLKNQEDLIEEIGRIYGYNKIETVPLKEEVQTPKPNSQRELERKIKNILAMSGLDEVRGYSFYSREDAQAVGLDDENHVALMNPLSKEHELIRRTLLVQLLRAGKKSLSYFDELGIFDLGKVYAPAEGVLPREELLISGALLEKGEHGEQFFALKGILENLFYKLNIRDVEFIDKFEEDEADVISLHQTRKALIKIKGGEVLGVLGEITKSAHKYFGLKKVRACVFELKAEALEKEGRKAKVFDQLAKFPEVNRDLSMTVERKILAKDIKNKIKKAGGELLRKVELFDNFVNPENKIRSMAFHLTFADKNRTLTAPEVDEKVSLVIKELEKDSELKIKKV